MTLNDLFVLSPEIIVTVSALIILILDLFLAAEFKRSLAGFTLFGIVLAAVANAFIPIGSAPLIQGMLRVDAISQFLNLIFLVGAGVAALLSADYVKRQGIARGEYYALILLSTLGAMLMGSSANLIMIFLGLETLSIPLYILSAFMRTRSASQEAGLKYFLLGSFASALLLYGIALLYGATGSIQIDEILAKLPAAMLATPLFVYAGGGLLLVGLAFKAAVVPFHMWAPDVYEGAPTSATAFMAVAAKAGAFAALLRLFGPGLMQIDSAGVVIIGILAGLTMIFGNIAALAQLNLKRLLAYSSIAHAGYLLLAITAAQSTPLAGTAINGLLFYLLIYTLMTLGAFGVVILAEGRGENLSLSDFSGFASRHPWIAGAMAIFMVSLAGIPPTAGFIGKFLIFSAVIQAGEIGLALIGVFASVISVYYYLRVVYYMYMRPSTSERPVFVSGFIVLGVGLTAIAVLVFGIYPSVILQWLPQAASATLP
ncbi:NADH-quinone oxidoreductase subunit N [Candidatus Acetothermia bacterium]|nr:NADH-quinone oxidoreductase subunit N [Candidatus Acetothermia bacterium]MBI3643844.1 NADH-quinone oxidoreductase subunit N [Candidatus Acetothermia bacterium]